MLWFLLACTVQLTKGSTHAVVPEKELRRALYLQLAAAGVFDEGVAEELLEAKQ